VHEVCRGERRTRNEERKHTFLRSNSAAPGVTLAVSQSTLNSQFTIHILAFLFVSEF